MAKNTTEKLALLTATFEHGKTHREFPLDKAVMRKSLHATVSACQVFIFDTTAKGFDNGQGFLAVAPDEVAWPFPVMCFEVDGADSYIAESEDGMKILCILVNSRDRTFWVLSAKDHNVVVEDVEMTLTHLENNIVSFDFNHDHDKNCTRGVCPDRLSYQLAGICTSLLDVLSEETVWKQPTGGKCVSYQKPGNKKKKVRIPKPFVYIVGRKPSSGNSGGSHEPTEMEWTHQWRVRGHWRARNGIGKDRMGRYNQGGRTWISDHVRGPEDKPLVEKRRIVRPIKAAA